MGSGRHTLIDQDSWLDSKSSKIPFLTRNELKGMRVQEIIDDQGNWIAEKVLENFTALDAETIINTPIGGSDRANEIIWSKEERVFSL